MKRRFLKFVIMLAAVAVLVAAVPLSRDALINSWRCMQFQNAVVGLAHPANTAAVDSRSRVGLLYGNGNHCDYFAGQLRTYTGDFLNVQAHYETVIFYNAIHERDESVTVEAVQRADLPFSDIVHWQVPDQTDASLYLVYIYRNYEANADIRCH